MFSNKFQTTFQNTYQHIFYITFFVTSCRLHFCSNFALHYSELRDFAQNVKYGFYTNLSSETDRYRLTTRGVTEGEQGCAPPPWQAKCKKWAPLLACISVFNIVLIFRRVLCLAFFKNFSESLPVILGASVDQWWSLETWCRSRDVSRDQRWTDCQILPS